MPAGIALIVTGKMFILSGRELIMIKPKKFTRREIIKVLSALPGIYLFSAAPLEARDSAHDAATGKPYDFHNHFWGYAVDTTRCIGCCACMRACKRENNVPDGYFRTWVERYRVNNAGDVSVDCATHENFIFKKPEGNAVKAFFVPKLCNHCMTSVCNQVCPVGAAYYSKDGVVLVDAKRCIGCGYCVQACPYGSRYIHPALHIADKCTLCYHRITRGMVPACMLACPKEARLFGDTKDPDCRLSVILRQRRYRVLKPEMGTHPKCYYLGLDEEVI
jgi:tetrathionate reductase subunit B